jgi:hypothetical protein
MLTTLVLIIGGGAVFVLAVLFAALVTDAVRNGVPVSRLGVWAMATRHGYIDITEASSSEDAPDRARTSISMTVTNRPHHVPAETN